MKFERLIPRDGETWKDHPYISDVVCSSDGRVGNKKRMIVYNGSANTDGYLILCISRTKENVKISKSLHRIVAESFIGISRLQVNHINGVKTDNRPENLEYVTPLQNIQHAVSTGLRKNRSTNVHNSSFDEFKVLTLATYHNAGFGQEIIAEFFQTNRGSVTGITTHRTYKDFSFLFNKRSKDEHAKYTNRAIKENKWIIQKEIA